MAVLQTAPARGAIASNVAEIEELTAAALPADLVATCELSVSGYAFTRDQLPEPLETHDSRLLGLKQADTAVSIGIIERNDDRMPYNSTLLLGKSDGTQRKLHPVSYAPWNEHRLFSPGASLERAAVNGVAVATLICNDAWHPVMPWLAAHAGAEVILVPTASIGRGPSDDVVQNWDLILAHTARMLQCFVVFANRVGEQDGHRFWGGSRIIDPTGTVLARAGDGKEVIHADLDIAALRRLRRKVPILHEARPQLVASMLPLLKARRSDV